MYNKVVILIHLFAGEVHLVTSIYISIIIKISDRDNTNNKKSLKLLHSPTDKVVNIEIIKRSVAEREK